MIEKIDKILHLKIKLNTKDDYNIIGIEYYLHDTELQRKHSYRPNYKITFENCHQAGKINIYDMTDKQIKEYLRPFNPNDSSSLVQNFINIRDYGHIDKQKAKYYFDTDFVKNTLDPKLDEIILFTHKDTLSLNQKKAIRGEYEKEIDADTYRKLSDEEKKFYYLGYPNVAAGYEMIEFLNSFITKNSKYLSNGFFDCKLKLQSDNILNEINIYAGSYSFFLGKYININNSFNINASTVPLTELSPLCEKIFKDFNESKWISNLKPGLIKDLKNHIETMCIFTHTKETIDEINRLKDVARNNILNNKPISLTDKQFELIRQPNEIRISTNITPKGYMPTGFKYQRLNKEYADKLQNTSYNDDNYNKTGVNDMMFIMNFMTNIKTGNDS
jgi:hypothetical protein